MKKLFLGLTFSICLYAGQIVELAGDKDYPPYSYSENGVAKGVYVDIIKSIFSKIDGYDVKFKMMAWKKAQIMVKTGKVVGFFPPYYSKQRLRWTKFSEPILNEKTIIFAKDEFIKKNKVFPKDFYGTTLCLNRGFMPEVMGGDKLVKAIKNDKIKLVEASKNKDCLNRVKRGLADFYINDQFIDISNFSMIDRGLSLKSNSGHIGFSLKDKKYPYIDDLKTKIDNTIVLMKKNGDIENIVKKYKKGD